MAARFQRQYAPREIDIDTDGGAAFDVARQLDRFSGRFSAGVDPMIADQDANRIRGTIAEGGDVEPSLGLTPLQRARNEVAQRAHLDRLSVDVQKRATELHEEFNGDRMTDPDNFARMLDEHAKPALDRVPEAYRGAALEHFNSMRGDAVNRIKERAFENEDRRNADDLKAGAKLDAETAMKAARDGDEGALARASASIYSRYQDLIRAGVMGEEVAEREASILLDGVRAEYLFGQVLRGGGPSLEEVQAGKGAAASLSLEARDGLARQIQAKMAHERSEAAHARGVARQVLRSNGQTARALANEIEAGTAGVDEQRAAEQLLRTPGALLPAAHDDLRESYTVRFLTTRPIEGKDKDGNVVSVAPAGAINGTVAEAQAALGWLDGLQPDDATGAKIKEKSRKAVESFIADVTGEDPVGALSQRGAFPRGLSPVDFSSPEAFAASLPLRVEQTGAAEMQFGWEMPPLSKSEMGQLARAMDQMDTQQKAAVYGILDGAGEQGAARVREGLSKAGAPAYAQAGLAYARGDTATAEAILVGKSRLDAKLAVPIPKADRDAAIAESGIVGVVSDSAAGEIVAAAEALVAMDPTLPLGDAIKKAGGAPGTYNGKALMLPFGVTDEGAFKDQVEQITDAEVARMGGTPEIAAALRSGTAKLSNASDGRYFVAVGANVAPFMLDWSKVEQKQAKPIRVSLGTTSIDVTDAARVVGQGVDAALETGRAVIKNTTDPLAQALEPAAAYIPGRMR